MLKISLETKMNLKTNINTKPLMNAISRDMLTVVRSRFRQSRNANGERWADITHREGKPLVLTGSLRDSIRRSNTSNKAVIGTSDKRARIHNYGGIIRAKNKPYLVFKINGKWIKVKSVTIKARQYMGFNEQMLKKYEEMIVKYYQEKLGGKK